FSARARKTTPGAGALPKATQAPLSYQLIVKTGSGVQGAKSFRGILSPALSSTFGGGEGDKSPRWDRLDKDNVKLRL
ncbi:MAG: hypothetical protein P4M10_05015, partial [Verrucomicrobiae bacterium]|nr:hypothetical protein [Verrucomicrobiae bacterium]